MKYISPYQQYFDEEEDTGEKMSLEEMKNLFEGEEEDYFSNLAFGTWSTDDGFE